MSSNRFVAGAAAMATLMMMLAGCGGSDSAVGSGAAASPNIANNTARSTAGDTFLAKVRSLISTHSNTSQPDVIESVTVTTPEDTSPEPVI